MKKETIIYIAVIAILVILLGIILCLDIKKDDRMMREGPPREERFQKEEDKTKKTNAEDIDEGKSVSDEEIDLSKYDTNLTISKAGTYTLTGSFEKSVIVKADGDVTIILNGVNIDSTETSAIANGTTNALTIKLADGSTNNLSDGGSSEYDGCIFSYGKLIIEGNGTLNINGKQEDGEGIATKSCDMIINSGTINVASQDDGLNAGGSGGSIIINGGTIYIKANGDGIDSNGALTINGGTIYTIGSSQGGDAGLDTDEGCFINGGDVIAIGSDMLEKPESSSKQKNVCFEVTNKVNSGSKVEIKDDSGNVVASFEAKEDFKTLIISNNKLSDKTYSMYVDCEKVK